LSKIGRRFQVNSNDQSLGLACTSDGLSLAGAALLQKTQGEFAPRPSEEICALIKAAYQLLRNSARASERRT